MKKTWIKIACCLIACVMMLSIVSCAKPQEADLYITEDQLSDINFELLADSSTTLSTEGLDPLVADALGINNGIELKFDENGEFKIVVFSDVQDGENGAMKADTLSYMNYFLDTESPDLVLLSGDVICGRIGNLTLFQKYLKTMSAPMETRNIPWAQVNGNHEEGGWQYNCGIYKEDQIGYYMTCAHNVSKAGNVPGYGNYVLPILRNDDSGKIGYNIFCLDSHDYAYKYTDKNETHEYDYSFEAEAIPGKIYNGNIYEPINFEQIKWYWDTSVALQEYNGQENPITAMMTFHIPVFEMNYITENPAESGYKGDKYDPISAPELSAGLFWALYERGDVNLIANGHDHLNGFEGQYMGITMAYCATIGCLEYHTANSGSLDMRGIRVITIKQGENVGDPCTFTTEMIYVRDINGGAIPEGY